MRRHPPLHVGEVRVLGDRRELAQPIGQNLGCCGLGIRIRDGALQGNSPGTINYVIDEAQAASLSNPLTDVVIKALGDFHYDILQAEADYHHDGTLYLNFHIEGTSPRLDTSRPVHLNINSEQNVLSLLQSLEYAEGLNQSLDRRIRKQFEKP